ncbi:hypothetical protein BaRGS_00038152, partial [Batillaria attramentaria]
VNNNKLLNANLHHNASAYDKRVNNNKLLNANLHHNASAYDKRVNNTKLLNTNLHHNASAYDKRCVDEQGCQTEWYQESSDKAACFQYDPSVYTEDLVCHLCCHGDRCNAQLLPEKSTLYKP